MKENKWNKSIAPNWHLTYIIKPSQGDILWNPCLAKAFAMELANLSSWWKVTLRFEDKTRYDEVHVVLMYTKEESIEMIKSKKIILHWWKVEGGDRQISNIFMESSTLLDMPFSTNHGCIALANILTKSSHSRERKA